MNRTLSALLVINGLLVLSACSSGDPAEGGGSTNAPSTLADASPTEPVPAAYDPPTRFDATSAVPLPPTVGSGKVTQGGSVDGSLPVALHGTAIFIAEPDGMTVVDGLTGQIVTALRPREETVNDIDSVGGFSSSPIQPPVIAEVNGQTLVAVPVAVNLQGSGTSADHRAVEVLVADADTGRPAWSVQLPLPDWANDGYTPVWPVAVGLDATTMIIRAGESDVTDDDQITYGLDLATRAVRWQQEGFSAYSVGTGSTGGYQMISRGEGSSLERRVAAVSTSSGASLWQQDEEASLESGLISAGPHFVFVNDGGISGPTTLVNMMTGAVAATEDVAYLGIECHYDDESLTVCERDMLGDWTGTLDAASGEWLWSLPDETANRVAPTVTTAWHGLVYGRTENGPLLLDGRTGRDRSEQPGFAPYVVNEYLGVGLDGNNEVVAVPTSG